MTAAINGDQPSVVPVEPAAGLVLMSGDLEHPEFLLIKRPSTQKFGGGCWVFPGGRRSDEDLDGKADSEQDIDRRTAIRETTEEVGIPVDEDAVGFLFHWVTPGGVPMRYAARFFLAVFEVKPTVVPDAREVAEWRWFTASEAVNLYQSTKLNLMFPTYKSLDLLAQLGTQNAIRSFAGQAPDIPLQPRVILSDTESPRIELPEGYQKIEHLVKTLSNN